MDVGINNALGLGPMRAPVATAAVAVPVKAAAPVDSANEVSATDVSAATDQSGSVLIEEAVTSIQNFVQNIRRDLNFSLDDSSGRVVVKVTDSVSGEVIRQLPTEEALRLAERLDEARSLLFKAEA